MQPVNARRVLMGGLLAGLAMNVGHGLAEGLGMRGEMERTLGRLALPPLTGSAMVAMAASAFVIGVIAVWLYAALRPRYGAGPGTAARAGFAVWLLGCLLPHVSLLACGVLQPRLFTMSVVSDLIVVPLATLLGGWLYREQQGAEETVRAHSAHAHA